MRTINHLGTGGLIERFNSVPSIRLAFQASDIAEMRFDSLDAPEWLPSGSTVPVASMPGMTMPGASTRGMT